MIDKLVSLHKKDKLSHAILFCGAAGVGKYTKALELAQVLLGTKSLVHPDLHVVCPAYKKGNSKIFEGEGTSKFITVDDIREAQNKLYLKPYQADCSICIIDDADKMNLSAANCLLKTLEEPPSYVKLILVSSNKTKLLPTIVSRLQAFSFSRITEPEMEKLLAGFAPSLDKKNLNFLTRYSKGSFERLNCSSFFDSYSREVLDQEELEKHLETLAEQLRADSTKIKKLLETPSSETNLAAFLVEEPYRLTLVKDILLRGIVSGAKPDKRLEQIIRAEDEAATRNANLNLQLAAALSG